MSALIALSFLGGLLWATSGDSNSSSSNSTSTPTATQTTPTQTVSQELLTTSIREIYSKTKIKYECNYYTEGTTVIPEHEIQNQAHFLTSNSKALPHIFPGSEHFYCYVDKKGVYYHHSVLKNDVFSSNKYMGVEDLYVANYNDPLLFNCEYEWDHDGNVSTYPVLEFSGVKSRGYLVPETYDFSSEYEKGIHFTSDFSRFKELRYTQIEVPDNTVVCINYDYLNTLRETSKKHQKFNTLLVQYARSTWFGGMILPAMFMVLLLVIWGLDCIRASAEDEVFIVFAIMVWMIFYHSGKLIQVYSQLMYWKGSAEFDFFAADCQVTFGVIIHLFSVLILFLSFFCYQEETPLPNGTLVFTANTGMIMFVVREIVFVVQYCAGGRKSYFFYLPLLMGQKTPVNNFQNDRNALLVTDAMMSLLLLYPCICDVLKRCVRLNFEVNCCSIIFLTGMIYFLGVFSFEGFLWGKYKGAIYMLFESRAQSVYMEWFHICFFSGMTIWLISQLEFILSIRRDLEDTLSEKGLLPQRQ